MRSMKQQPDQFYDNVCMQPQQHETRLPGNDQDDISIRPSLPGNPPTALRQSQTDSEIFSGEYTDSQLSNGIVQLPVERYEETISIDDISSEMRGLQCRFVQDVVVGAGDERRYFANDSLARIENWNGTAADALIDGISVSKLVINPEFPTVASLRIYTLPLDSQRTAVARNARELNDWIARESEYRRNHSAWEAERRRLEELLTRRMVTYSRMWVKLMMYNRFDSDIDHWTRHYNGLLHPADDLDPNIVKSIIYQESRMGTAGRHLMPPPSDWGSAERHPIRSRFNLAQAIDSWGPQQWLMMQEMAPALFSHHHLDALAAGRRWMGMRNTEYAHHATFMAAMRDFFQHRDAAGNNFMGTPGRDLHEDYAFWIRTAIRWLFVKYQSLSPPSWNEAVRAYNGSGESARRYRDAVMARVGGNGAYAAETSNAWVTPGVSLLQTNRLIGVQSLATDQATDLPLARGVFDLASMRQGVPLAHAYTPIAATPVDAYRDNDEKVVTEEWQFAEQDLDLSALDPPRNSSENDIVLIIAIIQRPGDVGNYWGNQVRPHRAQWTHPLSELERAYITAMTDPSVPAVIQMRTPVDPGHMTTEEQDATRRLFGGLGADARQHYANYENRRRILAHYVYTHPATVRLQLGLYRLVRDINPLHFALERGWQIGSGREMFTGIEISRLGAAIEFTAALALIYGLGRIIRIARPAAGASRPPTRALTDPIYDLPPEGGGLYINGRWYTEHALERMAPDTPQVRAQLRTRVGARLQRIGISSSHPAYGRVLARALQKIDPRGVPPSVIEAEILRPGSTNVRVITAQRGQVVVTVIRR